MKNTTQNSTLRPGLLMHYVHLGLNDNPRWDELVLILGQKNDEDSWLTICLSTNLDGSRFVGRSYEITLINGWWLRNCNEVCDP